MARSNLIIPQDLWSDKLLSVDDWTINIHRFKSVFANTISSGNRVAIKPKDFVAEPVVSTNLEYDYNTDGSIKTKDGGRVLVEAGKNGLPTYLVVDWKDEDLCEPNNKGQAGARTDKNVATVNALAFDFDGVSAEKQAEILARFEGLCFVAHSTFSDCSPNKARKKQGDEWVYDPSVERCFRVIVALDEPLDQSHYNTQSRSGVWFMMKRFLPENDDSTKNSARLWYVPSCRQDREDAYWHIAQDGVALSTEALINAYEGEPEELHAAPPLVLIDNTGGDDGGDGDDDEASEDGGTQRRNLPRHIVRDDFAIKTHDGVVRTFGWVIENWNNLPKESNGNYSCYRYWETTGHSNTLGSAFVSRTMNTKHRIARYRCTWFPANRAQARNNDCDMTDFGIQVGYSNRAAQGFYPKQSVPSVVRMLEQMEIDLWQDARTGDSYFEGEAFEDRHYTVIQERFWQYYRVDANRNTLITAIDSYCEMNQIDTLKTYLEDLVWDGVPRLEGLFTKYLKAADTKINRAYGKRWAISCVARALDWGCSMHSMVILKGEQGIRKSSFFRIIAGDCALTGRPYFNDQPIAMDGGTDGSSLLRSAWIHEWAELSGMSKRETGVVKQFITKPDDTYRAKYARKAKTHKRHSVMVGTVNDDEIFKDETGNRRFWAVECLAKKHTQAFDPKELEANRDQLWAEAVHLYKQGVSHFLQDDEIIDSAVANEKFESVDVHRVLLEEWLSNNQGKIFRIQDMIEEIYMEEYEVVSNDSVDIRKRAKAIKPKSYINWYSAALKSMGCAMLNGGKKCRHNRILSRWYIAPTLDADDDFVITTDLNNGKTMEVQMNTDTESERYGMVKRVRKFGEEWVNYEDMPQIVQADWDQRYPKKQLRDPDQEQSTIPFPPKDGKGKFRFRM